MSEAQNYRRLAKICRDRAAEYRTRDQARIMLGAAAEFDRLAVEAERAPQVFENQALTSFS